ncbi:MAG TPA: bifunctional diaminohydroxyphosphoribosylaminopyrimidine deaminase/5-amino-6-(5-phosphoribosylamino)uracil reductase RibD [Alphaproteobacteria bacterium]
MAHMRAALQLARRNLGAVWPNPAVGCVLVRAGAVVGRGWTQRGGRPHAETVALALAGAAAAGATAYVTLEPCSHHGQTPPCANALIAAKVARVVAAVEDPDPRVSGGGFAALRQAGIALETGVLAEEAAELNAGFFLRVREGRPLVTLKAATTLDGRIATHAGESKWITGEAARHRAHVLRTQHDAVLVGVGTALADDPQLTARLPGLAARSPVRILLDPRLRLPLTAQLIQTANKVPTWIACYADSDRSRRDVLTDCGVELIDLKPSGDRPDMQEMLQALAARGITRVLVEGGGRVAGALLGDGLVDRLVWFRAGSIIGGDGTAVAAAFGVDRLAAAPRFKRLSVEPCGDDLMEIYAAAG